jgi:murein DD-endopeptidase MepM/ murein hydrolase activator NlpD
MKMKQSWLIAAALCLTVIIVLAPPSNRAWLYKWDQLLGVEIEAEPVKKEQPFGTDAAPVTFSYGTTRTSASSSSRPTTRAAVFRLNNFPYLRLSDLNKLLPVHAKLDKVNEEIVITCKNGTLTMMRDVPVVSVNGIYKPMDVPPVFKGDEAFVPFSFLKQVLRQPVSLNGDTAVVNVNPDAILTFAPKPKIQGMSVSQIASYLSFLKPPIKGAHVSTYDSHLPGAPRPYRHGVHEGIDWFSDGTGVKINKNTPIYSMADGVVVRADLHYREMTIQERNRLLALGRKNNGQTPEYILDKLRGRSVWVQYDHGVMARYVHLDRIADGIRPGQKVKAGQLIGYAGNSGTSDGAKGDDQGIHLHLDLFIYGEWFWKWYTMQERREILEQVFNR